MLKEIFGPFNIFITVIFTIILFIADMDNKSFKNPGYNIEKSMMNINNVKSYIEEERCISYTLNRKNKTGKYCGDYEIEVVELVTIWQQLGFFLLSLIGIFMYMSVMQILINKINFEEKNYETTN